MKPLLILGAVFVGAVYYCHHYHPILTMLVAVLAVAGFLAWCVYSSGGHDNFRMCGEYSTDAAGHESAHLVVSRELGYRVEGAVVNSDGSGFTRVPGWLKNPEDAVVMAAAGSAGENMNRFFDVGLNGDKSDGKSDAYWVHKLAKQIAAERGVSKAEVIKEARKEAARLVSKNKSQWKRVRKTLEDKGRVGNV